MHFQSCYKESWTKLRDGGYKLSLDAIPFQSAKASGEILSDVSLQLLVLLSCHGLKDICLHKLQISLKHRKPHFQQHLNPVFIMTLTPGYL